MTFNKSLLLIILTAFSFKTSAESLNNISGEKLMGQKGQIEPYQFIHCWPTDAKADQKVSHYIFDVRSDVQHRLYAGQDLPETKALDLKELTLLDNNVDSNVYDDHVDVQWTSHQNEITFRLIIQSTDGELMEGHLANGDLTVPIKCLDSHYE